MLLPLAMIATIPINYGIKLMLDIYANTSQVLILNLLQILKTEQMMLTLLWMNFAYGAGRKATFQLSLRMLL